MRLWFLGLFTFVLAVAPVNGVCDTCAPDDRGFCTSKVVRFSLSYASRDPIVRVNIALGKSMVIEMASPGMDFATEPVVGNETIAKTERRDHENRILVWARVPDRLGEDDMAALIDERTNLQIDLLGGVHLLVELRIADETDAVERLVLDFPERQKESDYVRLRLAKEERALTAKYAGIKEQLDTKIATGAQDAVSRAILQRFRSEKIRARSFDNLILVHSERIFQLGNQVHIEFTVRNRSRSPLALKSVTLQKANGGELAKNDTRVYYEREGALLGYNAEIRGVASVLLHPEKSSEAEYALIFEEDGGQQRKMVLAGLRF